MHKRLWTLAVAMVLVFMGRPAIAQCCGDCNGDGRVTVDELVAAATRTLSGCRDDGICADCISNLSTCNANLSACNANVTKCNASLGTCNGILSACNTNLTNTETLLTTCSTALTNAQTSLTQCDGDLARCQSQCGQPCSQRFPPTGQTTCWDSSGNQVPCSGTGQDGDIRAGLSARRGPGCRMNVSARSRRAELSIAVG